MGDSSLSGVTREKKVGCTRTDSNSGGKQPVVQCSCCIFVVIFQPLTSFCGCFLNSVHIIYMYINSFFAKHRNFVFCHVEFMVMHQLHPSE